MTRLLVILICSCLTACKSDPPRGQEAPSGGTAVVESPVPSVRPSAPALARIDGKHIDRYEAYVSALTAEVTRARAAFRAAKPSAQDSSGSVAAETWAQHLRQRHGELTSAARKAAGISEDELAAIDRLAESLANAAAEASDVERSLAQLAKAPVDALPPKRKQEVLAMREQQTARLTALRDGVDARRKFGDAAVSRYVERSAEIAKLQRLLAKAAVDDAR